MLWIPWLVPKIQWCKLVLPTLVELYRSHSEYLVRNPVHSALQSCRTLYFVFFCPAILFLTRFLTVCLLMLLCFTVLFLNDIAFFSSFLNLLYSQTYIMGFLCFLKQPYPLHLLLQNSCVCLNTGLRNCRNPLIRKRYKISYMSTQVFCKKKTYFKGYI